MRPGEERAVTGLNQSLNTLVSPGDRRPPGAVPVSRGGTASTRGTRGFSSDRL